jgi:hypothetical protein
MVVESIKDGWGLFFPDIPHKAKETFHYPVPFSQSFWRQYAEPLEDFIAAARWFRHALEELRSPAVQKGLSSPSTLNALLSPVRVSLIAQKGGKGLRQFWEPPSLLSTFALMALQDHVRPGTIIQCPCGSFFWSNIPNAKYHTDACEWRFTKRRHRGHESG